MEPSYCARDHARAAKVYHTRADVERGLDWGVRTRERNAMFCAAYVRVGGNPSLSTRPLPWSADIVGERALGQSGASTFSDYRSRPSIGLT